MSCKRKRNPEHKSPETSSKKAKMATKEELAEMHESLIKRFLDAQAETSRSLCQEFKQEIKGDLGGIKDKIDTL